MRFFMGENRVWLSWPEVRGIRGSCLELPGWNGGVVVTGGNTEDTKKTQMG